MAAGAGGQLVDVYAISSLLVVVAVSLVIKRVATVILVASGMSTQAARFQARSAFTGAGFTTSESERVVDHPLRRRVIMVLMLLGNAGIVAAVSSLMLGFQGRSAGAAGYRVLELVAGLLALVMLSRSAWIDRRLTGVIARVLRRYTDLPSRDLAGLLRLAGSYSVSELAVADGDWLADRTLAELALRDERVAVLGISRSHTDYVGTPNGATIVGAGDVLVVYGRTEVLRDLDHRCAGPDGDARHLRAVIEHERSEAS